MCHLFERPLQSRFTAAAARARAQQHSKTRRHSAGKLLCGERVHVHEPIRKGASANGPHLRRLAAALDAKVTYTVTAHCSDALDLYAC